MKTSCARFTRKVLLLAAVLLFGGLSCYAQSAYQVLKAARTVKYKIEPAYNMKNIYHLKLTTTLEVKVGNILSSIYNIHKNRKQNKKLCIN